jgi:ubiquinone/menaquinone biosynthesis C-methylase UbiE
MKRVVIPELLDVDAGTSAEIADALLDLEHINSWFGGVRTTVLMVMDVARKLGVHRLSMLEVAAGAGFVPQAAAREVGRMGVELKVTLLDRAASHLSNGDGNSMGRISADALALPFRDASFDLVSCCLFTHHLSSEQIATFVNEGLRVARHALLINDLVRRPLHLALSYASLPLYRSRITRHDAPASVKRAYTVAEMRAILQNTRARSIDVQRRAIYRMGVVAWK